MKHKVVISGALANCGNEASTEELLTFLKSQTRDVDYYKLSPPPGVILGAAFDWQAILGVTASALAIGQALWAAYVKFVQPKKKKGDGTFLFVAVNTADRRFVQFTIGRENQDKEAFIQEFTEKVEQLRVSSPDAELVAEKRELRVS